MQAAPTAPDASSSAPIALSSASSARLTRHAGSERSITVLTGATGGIGRGVAMQVAGEGHMVVLPCRNAERAERLCHDVREATGNPDVFWTRCDFASLAQVREGARELREKLPRIDTLINNAGRFAGGFEETVDGFESHLAINYMAPFLLTHLLLPKLRAAKTARVVNVAGETARFAYIRMSDLNRRKWFTVLGAYGQSKLAVLLFSRLLAEALAQTSITISAMQPGMAASNHLKSGPAWLNRFWRAIAPRPERAAGAVTAVALAPHDPRASGRYYFGRWRAPAPCAAYRRSLGQALYARTAELVGLDADLRLHTAP